MFFICFSHYTIPLIPDIEGIDSYEGETVHSHYYRSPEVYKDKSVLVLGAGPSGTDIALDLSPHASKVCKRVRLSDQTLGFL